MRRRLFSLVLVATLVLGLGAGTTYLLGIPRLLAVSPAPGSAGVPAGAPVRLSFSRAMDPDSLAERLTIQPNIPGQVIAEGKDLLFQPGRAWPSGAQVTVKVGPGVRAARFPVLGVREGGEWSFTTGYARLLYLYPADRAANIYLMDPFTQQSLALTASLAGVLEFDVDELGGFIYYSLSNPRGGSSLYRIPMPAEDSWQLAGEGAAPETARPELVLECPAAECRAPQVAPNGSFLAYEQTGLRGGGLPVYPQVWLLPLESAGEGQAATPRLAGEADHITSQPFWSPDGRLTFYDSSDETFVFLEPASGAAARLANDTGQPGSWSPDGQVFITPQINVMAVNDPNLETLSNSHLLQFDLKTGETRDLSQAANLEDAVPSFSPTGAYLAFARKYLDISKWTPGRQLWLAPVQGDHRVVLEGAFPLTNDPYYTHFNFAWSPSGDRLALVRFNQTEMTEPPEIWLIDPATTRATRLVVGGYAPLWIP